MTYNLANELDRARFTTRADALAKKGAVVELTEKVKRTTSQNAYLHLLIGVVALETGNGLDYCKEVYFKRIANAQLFLRTKQDPLAGSVEVLRSSSDLSKEEMTLAIDRFKRWAAENGMYMPEPGDEARLRDIQIELERASRYL